MTCIEFLRQGFGKCNRNVISGSDDLRGRVNLLGLVLDFEPLGGDSQ